MRLEVRRTGGAAGDDQRGEHRPEQHRAHKRPGAAARRLRLPVPTQRGRGCGWVDRASVPVDGSAAPHPSLERGLHAGLKQDGAPLRGRQPTRRIAESPASG